MPKVESWKSIPVESEIILTLIRNRGEMLTTDLYRYLTTVYEDFSKEVMMDYLFRLEVRSIVSVVQIKKDVMKVEIGRKAPLTEDLQAKIRDFRH
jgi:hypothetical protein